MNHFECEIDERRFFFFGSFTSSSAATRSAKATVCLPRSAERVRTAFRMVVEEADAFLDPFSPTHGLERERRDGHLVVELKEELPTTPRYHFAEAVADFFL